jgi:hypothetical protein
MPQLLDNAVVLIHRAPQVEVRAPRMRLIQPLVAGPLPQQLTRLLAPAEQQLDPVSQRFLIHRGPRGATPPL